MDTPSSAEKGRRFAMPISDTDRIDLAGMRESSREKLKHYVSDPEFRREMFGAESPDSAPSKSTSDLDKAAADMCLRTLDVVDVTLAMKWTGCSREIAQIVAFTAEERKILGEPLARILSKYTADWLTKYGDEIAFIAMLSTFGMQKYTALMAAIQQARATPATPAAPVSEAA